MKNRWIGIVVVAVSLGHPGDLRAELITIFDTLEQSIDGNTNLLHMLAAQRFQTDGFSYKVYSATLDLWYTSDPVGTTTLKIVGESGGKPNIADVKGTFTSPVTTNGSNVYSNLGGISLAANTNYWMFLSATSGSIGWNFIADGLSGTGVGYLPDNAVSGDVVVSWTDPPYTTQPYSMSFAGDKQTPAVPEPSSLLLSTGLMIGLFLYRRRTQNVIP